MIYKSGEKIELGDRVVIEKGKTPGIVHAIIESQSDRQQWAVEEKGLLLESKPFGLVFWPATEELPILVCRLTNF